MSDWSALVAQLEAATAAPADCRACDKLIGVAVNPGARLWTPEWWSGGPDEYLRWPDEPDGAARYERLPHYTSSLDAATALLEKMLPEWEWCVATDWHDDRFYYTRLHRPLQPGLQTECGHHAAPLSLCLALFRTLNRQSTDIAKGDR